METTAKLPTPKPSVHSTELYRPGRPIEEVLAEFGLDSAIKLASNENLFGISPKAREALLESAEEVTYYPDTNGVLLCRKLAERLTVPEEQVVLGNGSVEIIYDLIHAYIGPGTSIVAGAPSFTAYPIATRLEGGEVVEVPLTEGHGLDLPAMAAAIRADTRLVFLPNPNNPTGTMYSAGELDAFLARVPSGVLVIVDEAYHDFMRDVPGYPDSMTLRRAEAPVAVLRSQSKSLGIAGLRSGYGVFPAPVAAAIRQVQIPFHCSVLALAATMAGLDDEEFLTTTRERLDAAREDLYRGLEELGCGYVRSFANFVMVGVDEGLDGRMLARELMRRGVIVRPGEDLGAPGWLRVTVGPEELMDRFLAAWREVLEEARAA